MNRILTISMLFAVYINVSMIGITVRKITPQIRTFIRFWLYGIYDGIKTLFTSYLDKLFKKIFQNLAKKRDLFTINGIRLR